MKKVYEMQVYMKVWDAHNISSMGWVSIRQAPHQSDRNPKPYQYNTPGEARRMLNICYPLPLENHLKRVVSIGENGIMEVVK